MLLKRILTVAFFKWIILILFLSTNGVRQQMLGIESIHRRDTGARKVFSAKRFIILPYKRD